MCETKMDECDTPDAESIYIYIYGTKKQEGEFENHSLFLISNLFAVIFCNRIGSILTMCNSHLVPTVFHRPTLSFLA